MSTQVQPQLHAIIKDDEITGGDVMFAWIFYFMINGLVWLLLGWNLLSWIIRALFLFRALSITIEYFMRSPSTVVFVKKADDEMENSAKTESSRILMDPKSEQHLHATPSSPLEEKQKPAPIANETTIIHHALTENARAGIRFCPSCGSELLYPNSAFCANCGMKF